MTLKKICRRLFGSLLCISCMAVNTHLSFAEDKQIKDDVSIKAMIEQMDLRQKVGQLFVVLPDSIDPSKTNEQVNNPWGEGTTGVTAPMESMLGNYPVGGIAFLRKNIDNEAQISNFIVSLQEASRIPLFMAVDEEGGRVARLANHKEFNLPKYESPGAIGKSKNPEDALNMGLTIGSYLKKYGFNVDFAPVADVNTNPNNPIIGTRAFSPNAEVAADMSYAMATGLKENNIIPVYKHFPGHGDTKEDSHLGLAVNHKTVDEMLVCEWLPYRKLTNLECVMMAHVAAPKVTGDLTPATMSSTIVNILRKQLNFNGIIITDALNMGAITEYYGSGPAAVTAFKAGCDILLVPYDFKEAFTSVLAAVESGEISEARLNESIYRILTLKKVYGIIH